MARRYRQLITHMSSLLLKQNTYAKMKQYALNKCQHLKLYINNCDKLSTMHLFVCFKYRTIEIY